MNQAITRSVLALLCALGASQVFSQSFPDKPMRVIVPFTPGGTVDLMMRALGPQVSESTRQPVLIENRPGASTLIGMQACAKAPPDGYTVCATTQESLSYSVFLYTKVPFDVENDFVGVTKLALTNTVIYTGAGSPFSSFKDFIAQARAKPGSMNMATWGPGTLPDLLARQINRVLGLDIMPVAYKGGAPALTAAVAGEAQLAFLSIGGLLPYFKSGKAKPLVVTAAKRSPFLPEVPSLAEFGADMGIVGYFGLYAPTRVPALIIERLNHEYVKALRTSASAKFLQSQTLELAGDSAAEFTRFLKADRENAGRMIRSLGIKPQDVPG